MKRKIEINKQDSLLGSLTSERGDIQKTVIKVQLSTEKEGNHVLSFSTTKPIWKEKKTLCTLGKN